MEKHKQIKRNHHYVWSHYLKSWADDKEVFYISQKGKVSSGGVKGLAKEVDFYKITPLDKEDIEYLKKWSSKSPRYLQKLHRAHLKEFVRLSKISKHISHSRGASKELITIDKAIQHNSLEDLHSFIEQSAIDVVSNLSQGNSECLKYNQSMVTFCSYLGHQISRTQAFKEKTFNAIHANPMIAKTWPVYLKLFEKNWWFLSFMFGTNIGVNLYSSRACDNHMFITNNTDQPFIASDNPIINVHPSMKRLCAGEPPVVADFFMPLSPRYAYMINNSSNYNHLSHSINRTEVMRLNKLMLDKSHKTVFSNSESTLKELKALDK